IIVVKPRLAHARILIERVVPANPVHCSLDAWVALANAGVEKALESAIGHAAQRSQAAGRGFVGILVFFERMVSEAAFIFLGRLLREWLIIGFARQILTAAHEDERLLDGRVVLGDSGSNERFNAKARVG